MRRLLLLLFRRLLILVIILSEIKAQVTVVFSVEVSTANNNSNSNVMLNETVIAKMVLFDPLTNTTVQLEPLATPVATESIVGVLPSRQCANTSLYWAGEVCQECQRCDYVTLQTCSAYANSVCDTSCPAGARLWHGLCTLCAPGYYTGTAGGSQCYACVANTYAAAAGQSACDPCPDGFASKEGASTCVQTCTPSAGTYCPTSTSAPTACLAGYYCTGIAGNDHIACPLNTYRSTPGATAVQDCLPCEQFTVAGVVGSAACHLCASGSVYASTLPDFSDGTCTDCSAGSTSAINATSCAVCAPGSVAAGAGSATCSLCRPGNYQEAAGASVCTPCGVGKYTYTTNGPEFAAVWGASSASECLTLPSSAAPLVCLPGTWMDGSGCSACPLGYFCPQMTLTASDINSVRACSGGGMPVAAGALAQADCTVASLLQPFVLDPCSLAAGGLGALAGLTVTAMTTSLSTNTVYFTTATAVYRLNLVTATLELLAGEEGTAGYTHADAIGVAARFGSLTAIGVDLDGAEAGIIVVGDGSTVRLINVFSRTVTLVGGAGDVGVAKGIALRRDSNGVRVAYVSDGARHRIMAFNLENLRSFFVAGDLLGEPGYVDGYSMSTSFNLPQGIAFLERSMNSSKLLLVADTGNNVIRVIDTDTRAVSTWFKPLDMATPELVGPSAVVVGLGNSPQAVPIVYVTSTDGTVSAIQLPVAADHSVKVLSVVQQSVPTGQMKAVFPHGELTAGANNAVGYAELVVFEGNTIRTLVEDMLAATVAAGAGTGTCHLPCTNADCSAVTPAALCGNSFLDPGEECDNGFANSFTGCNMTTCLLKPGFVCAVGEAACMEPYKGFLYAPTGVYYRAEDCAAHTPTAGYTIDAKCVETDIDECVEGTAACDVQAKCINTAGSYQCECFETYFGDGLSCTSSAYAVYTLVDIPALPKSAFGIPLSVSSANVLTALQQSYATALSSSAAINGGPTLFNTKDATVLAHLYTTSSVDPVQVSFTRLEVVTLFENSAKAALVASQVQNLATALTAAVGTTVTVFQTPKVRVHRASASYAGSSVIDGWGMDITSVTYNRTCVVGSVTPTGGCWQVEMIYVGGAELSASNENPNTVEQSKNVLYLPRLDHNAAMALTSPAQALTMSSGAFFPCDVSATSAAGKGMTPKATSCCLRTVESLYRPHAGFADFLNSAEYNAAAPLDNCRGNGIINDTFPQSNIVFKLPQGDGLTNDLVVGNIEGMPHSEVRLLETIDYTTRTFRVLLVLEEGDLRMGAAVSDGIWGLEYNMTFFVGLANFKGTGTSVMNTRNSMEFITVSKSNVLTISTFGANQDPLVSSVDMQLKRIKVTDYFQPVSYLYYLQPVFTLPSNFKNRPDSSIVPLNSIRLIKSQGLPGHMATEWMQACASLDGNYIYANTSLQTLVQHAQSEPCVQSNLQMCYPPDKASNVVSFGIPLPIDFIKSNEYSVTNPYTLNVEFVVQAYDTAAMTNVFSTLAMSVDITPLGFTALCETSSASQTLADIIEGNIYIGTATTDAEWDATLQKKTNIDVPGSTPSDSFEFSTVTVQGAVTTFSALGAPGYFDDARYQNQFVHIHDIHSVHFLEPLGSKSGPSPNFDAVKALFLAGKAFLTKTDAVQHSEWLVPSPALLNLCPYKATAGKMACLTRTESTFKNTVLTRDPNMVVELRQNDLTSVAEMKSLMARVILQGGVNDFTDQLGAGFYDKLSTKLALNNRYRKAYVVNPIMDWSFEAMNMAQTGATGYTVSSKVLSIGLITLRTPDGTQLARRLLSTDMSVDLNAAAMLPRLYADKMLLRPSLPHASVEGGRRLLQAVDNTLLPSMTQIGNALVVNTNVPGYDATTQLCTIVLGAPYSRCNIVQLQTRIKGTEAVNVCRSNVDGTLGTSLQTGLRNIVTKGSVMISGIALLEYGLDGCETLLAGGRRLLATTTNEYTILTQKVILSSVNGSAVFDTNQLVFINEFFNSTTWSNILGGGGFISTVNMVFTDSQGGILNAEIIVKAKNATIDVNSAIQGINNTVKDLMFVKEYVYVPGSSSSSSAEHVAVVGLNLFMFMAFAAVAALH